MDGAGPVSAQLFLHGTLIIIAAAFVKPPLVLAGAHITTMLRNNERIALWMDRSLGALFIALGIRLVVSDWHSTQAPQFAFSPPRNSSATQLK